jgi:hypothetical protein
MYGPLVLAGDLGPLNDSGVHDTSCVPVIITENRDPSAWMKPVDGKANTFITINTGRQADVEMKPFYTIYNRHYSVYWDLFNEKEWQAKQSNIAEISK